MELVTELWQVLTVQYPAAGIAVAAMATVLLLVWGVKASAY